MEFSCQTRQAELGQLRPVYDAVIVGGGIVGAGLARELAIRGVSTLLVEQGDFASGTSSRSSKLIHGGLRYLEMLDFHLVFEALAERRWLLTTQPHLVHTLEFNLPIYSRKAAPPGSRSGALLALALWIYDGLSLFHTPFFHGRHGRDEALSLFPGIREEGLKGSRYYADAMMLDDEMVLECLADARRRGVTALNYARVERVLPRGTDGLFGVELVDVLDGRSLAGGTIDTCVSKFGHCGEVNLAEQGYAGVNSSALLRRGGAAHYVAAHVVVSCTGPWTERFGARIPQGAGRKLKPSKGVHLILPWERFKIDRCVVMSAPDRRIVFAIPRKDLGSGAEKVIVGTTDSPEAGDPGEAWATAGDVEYLLAVLRQYFPGAGIGREDILTTYAGVRPLLEDGAASEADTSREHEIWKSASGVIFLAGGKYTTFRKISQELADFAFPSTRTKARESRAPLSDPAEYEARQGGARLWGRFTEGWVRWKIAHHAPCTLQDIVFRRMPLWMEGRALLDGAQTGLLGKVARIARPYFGWDEAQADRQLEACRAALELGNRWRAD